METYTGVELPTNPTRFMNYEMMTRDEADSIDPDSVIAEAFFSMKAFVPSSLGFCQWDPTNVNLAAQNKAVLTLFGFAAASLAHAAPRGTNQPTIITTIEMVANVKDEIIGFRLRLTMNNPAKSMASVLQERFFLTGKEASKQLKKGKVLAQTGAEHTRLDYENYRRLCMFYHPDKACDTNTAVLNIEDISSPLNPLQIFTLERSMHHACKAGAADSFIEHDQYRTHDGGYKWPSPQKHVYIVDPKQLDPLHLFQFFFPHIERAPFSSDAERLAFIAVNAVGVEPTARETARYGKIYDQQVNSSVNHNQERSLQNLALIVKPKMLAAKQKARDDPRNLTKLERMQLEADYVREVFIDSLDAYHQVMSPFGAIGDSFKAQLKWEAEFLKTNNNSMCLPVPRVHSNLTRTGEFWTLFSSVDESTHGVNTAHCEIAACYISALSASSDHPLKIHQLHLGPPKLGKSFMIENVQDKIIEGSFCALSYSTAKAMAAPGCKYDNMNIFYEEFLPSMLGIGGKGKGGEGGDETDMCAFMKGWLTTGIMNFITKRIVNGVHENVKHMVRCSANVFGAGNFTRRVLPPSMASRFFIVQHQAKGRNSSLKNARPKTPQLQALRQNLWTRLKRIHCLSTRIWTLITCGMLEPPDLAEIVEPIFLNVLAKAHKRGLTDTDDPRHMTRLRIACSQIIIISAITILFDNLNTPLTNLPWDVSQLQMIRKYLVGTTEHATLTLGMFQEQFEQKNVIGLLTHMKKNVFAKVAAVAAAEGILDSQLDQRQPAPVRPPLANGSTTQTMLNFPVVAHGAGAQVEEQKEEVYIPYVHGSCRKEEHYYVCKVAEPRWTNDSQHARLRNVACQIQQDMSAPKPSEDEVEHALEELSSMFICVDKDKETKIPAFELIHGYYRIACSLVDKVQANVLRDCTLEVLCHPYTEKRTVVWGHTDFHIPYQYDLLHIVPKLVWAVDKHKERLLRDEYDEDLDKVIKKPFCKNVLNIINPAYFDEELVRLTRALVEETPGNHLLDFNVMFSSQYSTPVDTDLDANGVEAHLSTIAMTPRYGDIFPSAKEKVRQHQEEQVIRKRGDWESLTVYPKFDIQTQTALISYCVPRVGLKRLREERNPEPEYDYFQEQRPNKRVREAPNSPVMPALEDTEMKQYREEKEEEAVEMEEEKEDKEPDAEEEEEQLDSDADETNLTAKELAAIERALAKRRQHRMQSHSPAYSPSPHHVY